MDVAALVYLVFGCSLDAVKGNEVMQISFRLFPLTFGVLGTGNITRHSIRW